MENTDNEIYAKIREITDLEKNGKQVDTAQKDAVLLELQQFADKSNDFDVDNLDNIIAFAQSYSGNSNAEAILNKANEQKKKIEAENAVPSDENTTQPEEKSA